VQQQGRHIDHRGGLADRHLHDLGVRHLGRLAIYSTGGGRKVSLDEVERIVI